MHLSAPGTARPPHTPRDGTRNVGSGHVHVDGRSLQLSHFLRSLPLPPAPPAPPCQIPPWCVWEGRRGGGRRLGQGLRARALVCVALAPQWQHPWEYAKPTTGCRLLPRPRSREQVCSSPVGTRWLSGGPPAGWLWAVSVARRRRSHPRQPAPALCCSRSRSTSSHRHRRTPPPFPRRRAQAAAAARRLKPLFDRVLIQKIVPETVRLGRIWALLVRTQPFPELGPSVSPSSGPLPV